MKFKDESQIRIDDEFQFYGVDKSALDAPLLIRTDESELDTIVTPSSFIPPMRLFLSFPPSGSNKLGGHVISNQLISKIVNL